MYMKILTGKHTERHIFFILKEEKTNCSNLMLQNHLH